MSDLFYLGLVGLFFLVSVRLIDFADRIRPTVTPKGGDRRRGAGE